MRDFFSASRPRTWPASLCPVILGGILCFNTSFSWPLFLLCLAFSLCIQIGTNFANDYFDWLHGVDTAKRVGPTRAVASGLISAEAMKRATILFFSLSFILSLPLVNAAGPSALIVVFSSILFGVLYTAGPKPLGYLGLGDPLVLFYFGPVPLLGTFFIQQHRVSWPLFFLSLSLGSLSCAILIANNLRDEETDRAAGKKSLVVRFGKTFGRWEYAASIFLGALLPVSYGLFFPLAILPFSIPLLKRAFSFKTAQEAAPLLPQTALLLLLFTLLVTTEVLVRNCL